MGGPQKTFSDHYARLDTSDPDACWAWPGGISDGYGQLTVGYRKHKAHKFFYEALVGPVPDEMVLDHTCHDPLDCKGGKTCLHRRCCNPAHLQVTTRGENVRRGATTAFKNAHKTHCKHGHAFTTENTLIRAKGGRTCRECDRQRGRRYYQERTQAA